jgi:hypothetical protein
VRGPRDLERLAGVVFVRCDDDELLDAGVPRSGGHGSGLADKPLVRQMTV